MCVGRGLGGVKEIIVTLGEHCLPLRRKVADHQGCWISSNTQALLECLFESTKLMSSCEATFLLMVSLLVFQLMSLDWHHIQMQIWVFVSYKYLFSPFKTPALGDWEFQLDCKSKMGLGDFIPLISIPNLPAHPVFPESSETFFGVDLNCKREGVSKPHRNWSRFTQPSKRQWHPPQY